MRNKKLASNNDRNSIFRMAAVQKAHRVPFYRPGITCRNEVRKEQITWFEAW